MGTDSNILQNIVIWSERLRSHYKLLAKLHILPPKGNPTQKSKQLYTLNK